MDIEYNDCESTLKDTSLYQATEDEPSGNMVQSLLKVFSFDGIKEKYSGKFILYDTPSSNDALFYAKENDVYFIEFKNGRIDQYENGKIKFKFLESILMFLDIAKKDLDFTRKNVKYILVYNYDKNCNEKNYNNPNKIKEVQYSKSSDKIVQSLMRLANIHLVRFDLARYINIYVKEVYTFTVDEFEENFIKRYDESYNL